MKITLSLYEDPNGDDEPLAVKSNMWMMRVNGHEFPESDNCLMSLKMAKDITERLIAIEELDFDKDIY